MTKLRGAKIDRIAESIKPVRGRRSREGDLLVVGWGSTYGAIRAGTRNARKRATRWPTLTSAISTRSLRTWASSSPLRERADPGAQHGQLAT